MPDKKTIDMSFRGDRANVFSNLKEQPELKILSLTGPAPDLDDPEYSGFARRVIQAAFNRRYEDIDETVGERCLLAWRMTRSLCKHLGLLGYQESLETALQPSHSNPDPWNIPTVAREPDLGTDLARFVLLLGSPRLVVRLSAFDPHKKIEGIPGIPVLPPEPSEYPEIYEEWKNAIQEISKAMGISVGTVSDPAAFSAAMPQLLFRPKQAWPSRNQILAFEQVLLHSTLGSIVSTSVQETKKSLFMTLGLHRQEVEEVISLARQAASQETSYDVEEARGMMILRLEDFVKRCRDSLDHRAELAALKQLAQVQGLQAAESGDLQTDFIDVVRSTARRQTLME